MITLLREFTKTWIFKGLMVLLVAGFAIVGVGIIDPFRGGLSDNVIVAGDRKVSVQEFKTLFDRYKEEYPSQNQGQTFTNEEFVAAGRHLPLINGLADQTSFAAWLDSLGVKASAKMIVAKIAKIPAFFNSITGKFDRATYLQRLAQAQMTEKMLDEQFANEIAAQQYYVSVSAGFRAPRIYAAAHSAMMLQSRDSSLFVITDKNVAKPAPPTEAELVAFYNQHQAEMQQPEFRAVSVVRFSPDRYVKSVTVDEAVLHKMYDDRLKTLASAETRTFVQVTAQSAGDANAISAALKAGQTPEAAAKAHKGQVIAYTLKPQSAVPDAKVGAAAFALKTGEISGAIQGGLGYSVVKMGEIKIGSTPSFESVRPQLTEEYITEQAANRVNKDSNAFSDAIRAGKDFDATAKELGLEVVRLEPMTAEGQTPSGGSYSAYVPLVKAIYDLPSVGAASDVEELGDGQYFAVRLDGIKPAGALPYEQVKPELEKAWSAEKVVAAIQAKGEEAMARLDKGESMEAVAASMNAAVLKVPGMSQANAQQSNLPPEVANRIFISEPGKAFSATVNGVFVVARVDAVHQANAGQANMMSSAIRPKISDSLAGDIFTSTTKGARVAVKTKVNPAAAELALGITPPDPKAKKAEKVKP